MQLKARVRGGRVVLNEPYDLPEGTLLDVVVNEPGQYADVVPAEDRAVPVHGVEAAAYRAFFDNAAVGAMQVDPNVRIIRVNKRYCEITGYPEEELIGLDPTTLDHPDERVADREHVLRFLAGEIPGYFTEKRYIRKDGSTAWVQVHAAPVIDSLGTLVATAAIVIDVSDRKNAERELQESRSRFDLAARGALDGLWDWNIETGHDYFSERWCAMLGYAMEELEPEASTWLGLIHPDDKDRVLAAVDAHLTNESKYDIDYRLRHREGSYVWVRASGQARWDQTGKPVRMAGSITDITANKVAEEREKKLQAELLDARRRASLSDLAGGIAHDFNNLLGTVLGCCDLARDEVPKGSEALTLLDDAIKCVNACAGLAKQMLAYSGRGRFALRAVSLSEVVEHSLRVVQHPMPTTCAITLSLAADLPLIRADQGQMAQMVMALLTNAFEALGDREGSITVTTRAVDASQVPHMRDMQDSTASAPNLYVELVISDTGVGMSEDTQSRIFDPFFSTKFVGRGLGLSAAQGIVRGHHGEITCASDTTSGTTFRVLLPVTASSEQDSGAAPARAPLPLKKARVLLVDDEPMVLATVSAMLRKLGCEVDSASGGAQAVSILQRTPEAFDLAIIDLTMPMMDGADTRRELQRVNPQLKAILASGYDRQTLGDSASHEGFCGFLPKPCTVAELRAAIALALA